ncbi:MAG: Na+/H+ antiporter subunit E [Luteolibacter sp.]|jgi:multicomponent Na+:H+ antiporter subunit E
MKWTFDLLCFACFYVKEVITANLFIAVDIMRPKSAASPGFIELPLGPMSNMQILLLTNLITMTPGTLSFDLSHDRKRLLIHIMYLRDRPEEVREHLIERYVNVIHRLFD